MNKPKEIDWDLLERLANDIKRMTEEERKEHLYTEEEVLEAIKSAFLDGFWAGIPGKTRYEINPKDYLPKR